MASKTLGIQFPLQDDNESNRLFQMDATQRDSVKSQLYFLLLTPLGTRWYMPDFGTNLRKYLFEPNDSVTTETIIQEINLAVAKYIPNLSVVNVLEDDTEQNPYRRLITVQYIYIESTYRQADTLTMEFNFAR